MTTHLKARSKLVVLPKLHQVNIERLVHNVCQVRSHMRIKNVIIISFLCTEEAYQSMQSYEARAEDELSFDIGVTLKIVEKNLDGWWLAR